MASLTLSRWERWEPDLGDNLQLPESKRFFLELRSGLSKLDLAAFIEKQPVLRKASKDVEDDEARAWDEFAEAWTAHLAPNVRLGTEPLVVDGAPIEGLGGLVRLYFTQANLAQWTELLDAFVSGVNSVTGRRELFSGRPSGGTSGTAPRSAARANSPAAAR